MSKSPPQKPRNREHVASTSAAARARKAKRVFDADVKDLHATLMASMPPLSAERIARGDTRTMAIRESANGDIEVLFVTTNGETGESSSVTAVKKMGHHANA